MNVFPIGRKHRSILRWITLELREYFTGLIIGINTMPPLQVFGFAKIKFIHPKSIFVTFISANLIALSQGWFNGWISPALPILASNSTPLSSGSLTINEISWTGSINCIGAVLGSLFFDQFVSLIGSKRVVHLLAVPTIVFWFLIYVGNTYYHILIARFICGLASGGVYTTVVLFISEIANDE